MTTSATRDNGLRRLSDLTSWIGVAAVAATGVFAGLAAHASHTSTTVSSTTASSASSSTATGGLTPAQAPTASVLPSHVRSGAS